MESSRGVWLDPGMGPNGEFAISIVDSRGDRLLAGLIPNGRDKDFFIRECYALLDRLDPVRGQRRSSLPLLTGLLHRPAGPSRLLQLRPRRGVGEPVHQEDGIPALPEPPGLLQEGDGSG